MTTASLTSRSAVPTTAAELLDAATTADPVVDEVAVPNSTSTEVPASTPAATTGLRLRPPGPAPARSAPESTLPTPVDPPSSSDPTTTPLTTVAPPAGSTPVIPAPTSPPPQSTLPAAPPTTSAPTTIDHKTLCDQLESQKQAIDAEIKQVQQIYSNDPVTRDRLTKQLQAEKDAVEQQRKAAHC